MMPRLVDVASSAARGLISRGVEGYSKLRGSNDFGLDPALGSPTAVLLLLLALVLYMVYRRLYCQTFGGLDALSVGGGKQGDSWLKSQSDVEVTWLGQRELKVLQACGDTLLPGFVIGHKEAANAAVGQTVAMVRSNMFPGKKAWAERRTGRANVNISRDLTCSNKRQEPNPLPPLLEAYVRALGRRCLEMQGRPGSDIGVAVLFAQAFETNISAEQRSGLRTLFWALSTRAGAFLLTGRAVPFHAQSLAARHAVLKRWSTSRTGKFREAFQGVKRLTCSLYFTAHPEVSPSKPKLAGKSAEAAAEADIKTNPNWVDIRYDPQHHRLAHNGNPNGNPAVSLSPSVHAAAAAKPWLWSGAKKGKVAQTGRAAAAAASSPTRVLSTNSNSSSNPPSPATSSAPPLFSAKATAATPSTASSRTPKIFFRSNSKSSAGAGSTLPTDFAEDDDPGSGASAGAGAGAGTCAPQPLPRELQVDVVVVGSGAGGGCAAGALAARGLKVAVLEKGGLFGAKDFAGFSEMEAYQKMYEGQGVLASDDAGVVILAGSCVGGGTTVNWAASFRTPRHVRLEWARKLGLKSFELDGPYDEALDAVCERLGVNTEHSHRAKGCPVPRGSLRVNQHQSSLWNGAVASGHVPRPVPRNAQGCVDCGSCLHGCAFGSKRSTHVTWLQDGLDSGNVILIPNAKVDKVLVDAGRAIGVEATVNPPDGQRDGAGEKGGAVPLTVRARAVVVSGGAINTPAILLRSGLKHPMIGRHLCLHPALVVGGVFPEDYEQDHDRDHTLRQENLENSKRAVAGSTATVVAGKQSKATTSAKSRRKTDLAEAGSEGGIGFCERQRQRQREREPGVGRGVMMGVYVQELMRLDRGYGCVIEAPPVHPGLMGLVLPWNDALSHRLLVGMARETSVFIGIGRDRSSNDNRVVLGPKGDPVIKYTLGEEDSRVILEGRSEMLRMMRKAGASMVLPAHEGAPWFCPKDGKEGDEQFQDYVDTIESLGTTVNEAGVYSAHQMGSCRLSANPEDGPLRETGETWECDGLFVADASVFPTSLGINPMITVEAVAYMVADQVATRLGKEAESAIPRGESSPLRRKIKTFGKAVVAAMSRESSCASDPGMDEGGKDKVEAWGVLPQSPLRVKTKSNTGLGDDFGVELGDLSW